MILSVGKATNKIGKIIRKEIAFCNCHSVTYLRDDETLNDHNDDGGTKIILGFMETGPNDVTLQSSHSGDRVVR
jgi:hypothetical protein